MYICITCVLYCNSCSNQTKPFDSSKYNFSDYLCRFCSSLCIFLGALLSCDICFAEHFCELLCKSIVIKWPCDIKLFTDILIPIRRKLTCFLITYVEQIRSIVSKKVGSFEQVYKTFHSHVISVRPSFSFFLKTEKTVVLQILNYKTWKDSSQWIIST